MCPPLRSASVRPATSIANGSSSRGDPREDPRVEDRAEVVGVRDEGVAVAVLEQRVEHPRGDERGVEVAVAGRRPLERRVGLPRDRLQARRRRSSAPCSAGSRAARRTRSPGWRRSASSESSRVANEFMSTSGTRAPKRSRSAEHLADDDVEEGLPLLGLDQRLGLGHAHARAQAAVELEHDRGVDDRRVALGQLVERGQVLDGLDVALGQHPRRALAQLLVVVGEGVDRGVADALGAHLLDARLQPVGAHAPSSSRCTVSGEKAGRQTATYSAPPG